MRSRLLAQMLDSKRDPRTRKAGSMSYLNNPLFVEAMQEEQKVKPRDMEMAQAGEAVRASSSPQSPRTFALISPLHPIIPASMGRLRTRRSPSAVAAIFAKLDVLGFERLEYELTPDAIDLGLDAALPPILKLESQIGNVGRGERI